MANFRLARDTRKEQTKIGKKVSQAAAGVASQKSSSMWGSIGGGLAGAALVGTAVVTSALTGGALTPLWLTMAGTGVGAALGSKLGEEVAEGGGLFKGGLIKATLGNLGEATIGYGGGTMGQADYEKASYLDPHKAKFFKEEVEQARSEIKSMSEQVSKGHITTGLKAGALAGAGDILKGTKIIGKGATSLGDVLSAPKGTFTTAEALGKAADAKAAVAGVGNEFKSLISDKALSSSQLGTKRLAHLGFDKAAVEAGDDALKATAKSYTSAGKEVQQRFFEQGAKKGGEQDWSTFLTAEKAALDVAGEDAAGFMAKSYQRDMNIYNQFGGKQNPIVSYQDDLNLNVIQDSTLKLDPAIFQGQVGAQFKSEIGKAYESGMSVAEAEASTMAKYGMERNTLLESVFSKKKTGEWGWK